MNQMHHFGQIQSSFGIVTQGIPYPMFMLSANGISRSSSYVSAKPVVGAEMNMNEWMNSLIKMVN